MKKKPSAQPLYIGHKLFYSLVFTFFILILVFLGYFYFKPSEIVNINLVPGFSSDDTIIGDLFTKFPFENYSGIKSYKKIDGTEVLEIWGVLSDLTENSFVLSSINNDNSIEIMYDKNINPQTFNKDRIAENNNLPALKLLENMLGKHVIVSTLLQKDGRMSANNIRLSPQGMLQTKYTDFQIFPDEYKSYLRLADKDGGMDFGESGFYYFEEDSLLALTGEIIDWGDTTVKMKIYDGIVIDILLPDSGIFEHLENYETALVTEQRKIYYINRKVVMELDLMEGSLLAKSILPLAVQ